MLLAAGKGVYIAAGETCQPDLFQNGGNARPHGGGRLALLPQSEGDIAENIAVRKERVILEHQTEIAPVRRDGSQRRAIPAHFAVFRYQQPGDNAQQRRFSAAAGAQHGDYLPLCNGEGNRAQRWGFAEGFGDTPDF